MTEITAVKHMSKKTWGEMASRGGVTLLLCQMRALANKAAKNALEKAGKKGLEENLFKGVFEQIGKKLTKQAVGKSVLYLKRVAVGDLRLENLKKGTYRPLSAEEIRYLKSLNGK